MKKNFQALLAAVVLLLCGTMTATAQTAKDTVYVFFQDHADAGYFLPAPPDTACIPYVDDLLQFQWGKTQRPTPRGEKASRESLWEPDAMRMVIAEALGLDTINAEQTPALNRLLVKSYWTGNHSTAAAKRKYMRTRPFVQMNDPLWAKYDTDYLRTNGSYPSGHTSFGWATALAFAEMWPELQDTILRRGFEFGENRIITGAHYQSDVNAGYLCADACIAHAHANQLIEKDILAARAEYARLKGLPKDYDPVAHADVPHGESILNTPVDTASYRYIGDLECHWEGKALRPTERGRQAVVEAEYSIGMVQRIYGEALGMTLTDENAPAITALLTEVMKKCSQTADRLKALRFRKRPFVQLGEPSFVPADEEVLHNTSSYPSGHTNMGWATALVMAEVAPDCQNEVLRRGYQYGYNRLIVGYHWATDIDAGRLLGSCLMARLHADPAFRDLIAKARKEYLKLRNKK